MPKKKILLLHSSSDLYGASRILLFTVYALKKNGHNIYVVLSEHGPLCDELTKLNVTVYVVRLGILRRKYFNPSGVLNRIVALYRAMGKLQKIIATHSIDLVYSNTTGVLAGAFVAAKKNVDHIWHIHEIINSPRWFKKLLSYLLNKYSSSLIVVSEAVKASWGEFIPAEKFIVIHNGIDPEPFTKSKATLRDEINVGAGTLLIGMIGRVHFWKGQDYFLRIASLIKAKNSDVKFIMVGDAFPGYEYLYDKLEQIKADLDLTGDVIDLGYRLDVSGILNGLDLFVLPSILPDPFPTVILEAMAAGKPVIATTHGGAPEMIVDGETGILIPWDNENSAYRKIKPLLESRSLRESMGMKGKQLFMQKFSLHSYEERLLSIFE